MNVKRIAVTGAAALILVAGGTAAYATIIAGPVDSSGVIHGCYTSQALNGSHVFVLQDAGTNCPKGSTAISWNQKGPAGPAGATGPAGNTGPAGPQGPAGQTGAAGAAGPTGAAGNTVLNGNGPPTDSSLGKDGDFYLDTQADVLYGPKSGGTWPGNGVSLVGDTGAAGPAGPQGDPGPQGPAGSPSEGVEAYTNVKVPFTQGQTYVQVLQTADVSTTGDYYVSATIGTWIDGGDGAFCYVAGSHTVSQATEYGASSNYQTIPVDADVMVAAGTPITVFCSDYNGDASTYVYAAEMNAILIQNDSRVIANVTRQAPSSARRPGS
jgi:hypothetical protein